MKQDFNTVFKAPKYTGVTLSLLSMFVLAAMFVVWQKFPQNQKPESNTKISVICDMKLRVPSINIISSFEKEYSCNINIKFLNSDEINKLNSNMIDMLIFNESDLAKIAGFNSKHISIIPFAFEKPFGSDNKNNRQPFSCLIKEDTSRSQSAFALARYFSAPSRGQFFLAEAGFPGIDGDQWKLRPSISIMVENNYEREISKFAKIFSDREGITLEVSSKNLKEANATINLISKSKAKEYLPDLLIGFDQLEISHTLFMPPLKGKQMDCLLTNKSRFKKTAIRFWKSFQNHV